MPSCRIDVEITPSTGLSFPFTCYYPSTCVKNYLEIGQYTFSEFCQTALAALQEANSRIKEKWGISCSGCVLLEHNLQKMLASEEFMGGEARVLHIE
ncbi:MAG: hypothetical protein RBG13Loki_2334 [Promethearchaeota archaeon CR_4]|nr:MAG: hypothetical protein RBG13Loki_2334 [Candidatus Lokiarchaeota archaeon CR_4]